MAKQKIKKAKARDWQAVNMWLHTKPGFMADSKKRANKAKCRGKQALKKSLTEY